jgi:hypothetical protein
MILIFQGVKQTEVMTRRQVCNNLLNNLLVRVAGCTEVR